MSPCRFTRVAALVILLVAFSAMWLGAGVAQAQDPTPTPTAASSGLNFRDYIKINSLNNSLSQEYVLPGQTFYADLSTEITWIGDSNPPLPISLLQNWSVTALYQIVGVAKDGSGEQVLGSSEMTLGPFRNVKTGDKFSFQQHAPLLFADKAPLNDYTVVVRPVGVRGGPFNAFGMAWPLIKGALPQEYAIGTVKLVNELPTPTPSPTPVATPTSQPTSTPEPTAVPGSSATPLPTATPRLEPTPTPSATNVPLASPTALPTSPQRTPEPTTPTATPPAPTPTPTPPPGASGTGTGWLIGLGVIVLALTAGGLTLGVYLGRRTGTPREP